MIGDADLEMSVSGTCREQDRRALRRVFGCVIEEVDKDLFDPLRVCEDGGQVFGQPELDGMPVQLRRRALQGCLQKGRQGVGFKAHLDFAAVELGHLDGFADEAVEPVGLFVDDLDEVAPVLDAQVFIVEQGRGGGLDGGERGPELVGDGVEHGGAEPFAFLARLAAGSALEGFGTVDGDGDEAAEGFEGGAGEPGIGEEKDASGADADTQGKRGAVDRGVVCRGGGELNAGQFGEGMDIWNEKPLTFSAAREVFIAGFGEVEHDSGGEGEVGDDLRDEVEDADDVIGLKEFAAEAEEQLHLALAGAGLGGLGPDAVGEAAADDGGEQEGKQGDPVLRIDDGEGADGREEVEIKAEGSEDGGGDGVAEAPFGGEEQDEDEQGKGDGGRIDMEPPAIDGDYGCQREQEAGAAEKHGESAKVHGEDSTRMPRQDQRRKSPEEWLHAADEAGKPGRLKVFLGYAPGVGKTYSMLSEGMRRASRGEEVVIGVVETHGRAGTAELAAKLEQVPRREIEYRGIVFHEMDVDAILARSPRVALVDELAHTNVEGSRNTKRYEDVFQLLEARIDVLTTINIQHIQSLTPQVQGLTGIEVRETVPDWVLDRAEEIVISDLTPEALVTRMQRGDIYPAERIDRALGNFFRRGNLIALREMALQRVTRAVDRTLNDYVDRKRLGAYWTVAEKVAVCVSGSPKARDLIARGARLAERLGAELLVLHVALERDKTEERQRALGANLQFARNLGAEVVRLEGTSVAKTTAAYMTRQRVTQAIFGRSALTGIKKYLYFFAIQQFVAGAPHVDLHIITQEEED